MIKAVVICEDHTLDEYVLKPVVQQIFSDLGRSVKIQIAPNSLVRGVRQALAKSKHKEVFERYPMADVFILIVDRDCNHKRESGKFADRISEAQAAGKPMFGCLAIEELEVWALAPHRSDLSDDWNDIRSHCHPKETYFEPFARQKGWHTGPGKGRKAAMAELRQKWQRLKNLCPEVRDLQNQVKSWLSATP